MPEEGNGKEELWDERKGGLGEVTPIGKLHKAPYPQGPLEQEEEGRGGHPHTQGRTPRGPVPGAGG
jgi:hypothetical protein